MIPIILLNWNGYSDTIECLKSIYKSFTKDFFIIVVDNDSTDDSIAQIINHLKSHKAVFTKIDEGEACKEDIAPRECLIYSLKKNYGFAKANNMALGLIKDTAFDYFFLLNNDTIVEPRTLERLRCFLEENKQYDITIPQIRYWNNKDVVWNCGGRLFAGFRKYYFAKKKAVCVKNNLDITFITGCAVFARRDVLLHHKIFTERFFFGEEDFELSIRMKKEKRRMKCVANSILYHKVNASCKHQSRLSKMYIHYLNRFINIQNNYSPTYFFVWQIISFFHIYFLLLRRNYSLAEVNKFSRMLNVDSKRLSEVNADYYHYIMNKW